VELEIVAGERHRTGEVALPEGPQSTSGSGGEEAKVPERELLAKLVPMMESRVYDTGAVRALMGG